MNTKQMQAALAKINPKSAKAAQAVESEPLLARAGSVIGATVPVVRKNADTFFTAMSTSYRYNEAVRKGQL